MVQDYQVKDLCFQIGKKKKKNQMPSIIVQNRLRVKYIIVKFQNTRDKEKIPRASKENANHL